MSKRTIKIIILVFLALIALLMASPFVFKNKIAGRVKYELNRKLDAELDFGTFSVSFLRSFPRVSLVVNDFSIVGKGDFEGDTLAYFGRSSIGFNVFSLFKKSGFEISRTRFDNARLHLKVLENDNANWDIVKDDGKDERSSFLLQLTRVEVNQGYIDYQDKKSGVNVFAQDVNLVLRGDLSRSVTTISTRNARIGSLSLSYAGMPLLSKVVASVNAKVEADLKNNVFSFQENEVLLNSLPVSFDGSVALRENSTEFDLTFGASRSEFKNFISVLPTIYTKDFETIESSGTLQLNGYLKGSKTEGNLPPFGIYLAVKDGTVKYPQLPSSVSGVNIIAEVSNPGKTSNETVVDVSEFKMLLGNNPVEGRLNLSNLVSDPSFFAFLKGKVNLGQVNEYLPLEAGTNLRGVIEGNLTIGGKMSEVNAKRYSAFKAEGYVSGQNILINVPERKIIAEIQKVDMRLSPQFLQVKEFIARINDSDISAKGRLDNIIGFLLDNQMLSGSFEATSKLFDLNLLMEGSSKDSSEATSELSAIIIPSNINLEISGKFDRVLYGNLQLTDITGKVAANGGVASLHNLRMKVLDGSLIVSGRYAYHEKGSVVDLKLDVTGLDIQKSFEAFQTFRMLAPVASHAIGRFSASLNLNGVLGKDLAPLAETLSGSGRFNSQNVSVQGVPALDKLSRLTHLESLKRFNANDILVIFDFGNGRVNARPFDFRIGQSRANVGGSIGFDQTLDYAITLDIPRSQFCPRAMRIVNDLQHKAAARGLTINIDQSVKLEARIGGTFTTPQVSFDLAQAVAAGIGQIVGQVQQQATTAITEQVNNVVAAIDAQLEARINAFLDQARQQAENVRQESRRLARGIRTEASARAKKLEDDAPNDLQKMLAKQAGKLLINQAEEQAKRVETEGDVNAQRIIDLAGERARKIRLGEEKLE